MLRSTSHEDVQRIRGYFKDAGFVHGAFRESPWLRELPKSEGDIDYLMERTSHSGVLGILVRLFFLGVPQDAAVAAEHIPEPVRDAMMRCGILRCHKDSVISDVLLTPCDDFLFAADSSARMRSGHSEDLVLWPNTTTRLLQMFAAGNASGTALDLGAGCGILGILVSPQCSQVTLTDLNPRAEEFARFNAWLNGVGNIEVLTGDTFEPVGGRKFDLIMANPPFFVTPGDSQMFCENNMELDLYCRRVVREAAAHLNEGGYFQGLIEWVQLSGEPWQERLAEWLEGSGCDAWIIRSYARDAAIYAEERIRATWPERRAGTRFVDWMAYYRQRGIQEVHGGLLAMRRRAAPNWLRIDEQPVDEVSPFGDLVARTFATQDILAAHPGDEDLLSVKPRVPSQAQLEQVARASEGRWGVESLNLRLTGPVPASMALDQQVAGFIGRCDGTRTLGELVAELAGQVNAPAAAVREQCCAVVRKLAGRRLLQLER